MVDDHDVDDAMFLLCWQTAQFVTVAHENAPPTSSQWGVFLYLGGAMQFANLLLRSPSVGVSENVVVVEEVDQPCHCFVLG